MIDQVWLLFTFMLHYLWGTSVALGYVLDWLQSFFFFYIYFSLSLYYYYFFYHDPLYSQLQVTYGWKKLAKGLK